jgi:hypothetical protein
MILEQIRHDIIRQPSDDFRRVRAGLILAQALPFRHPAARRVVQADQALEDLRRHVADRLALPFHLQLLFAVRAPVREEVGVGSYDAAEEAGAEVADAFRHDFRAARGRGW